MTPLILKLTAALRRLWRWRDDHYDVVENGGAHFSVAFRAEAPPLDVDFQRTRGPATSFWL
jgi:hypothetical protein